MIQPRHGWGLCICSSSCDIIELFIHGCKLFVILQDLSFGFCQVLLSQFNDLWWNWSPISSWGSSACPQWTSTYQTLVEISWSQKEEEAVTHSSIEVWSLSNLCKWLHSAVMEIIGAACRRTQWAGIKKWVPHTQISNIGACNSIIVKVWCGPFHVNFHDIWELGNFHSFGADVTGGSVVLFHG